MAKKSSLTVLACITMSVTVLVAWPWKSSRWALIIVKVKICGLSNGIGELGVLVVHVGGAYGRLAEAEAQVRLGVTCVLDELQDHLLTDELDHLHLALCFLRESETNSLSLIMMNGENARRKALRSWPNFLLAC